MYITDVKHFLVDKGAIAPRQGPAKAMADFLACVIAYASDFGSTGILAARCFKCKKGVVEAVLAKDNAVVGVCRQPARGR